MATQCELLKLKETMMAMKEAEKDDTPFIVASKDDLTVVGDPNKTKVKTFDYSLSVRVPSKYANLLENGTKSNDGKWVVDKLEFSDVTITPRTEIKIKGKLLNILKYFKGVDSENHIRDLSEEEQLEMFYEHYDELVKPIYDFVCEFLGVDDSLCEMIEFESVVDVFNKIIVDFPELYNGADVFFD